MMQLRNLRTQTWAHRISWIAIAVWLASLSVVACAPPSLARTPQAQAELLEFAAHDPAGVVPVIVQKRAPDDRVEQLVAHLGGEVTRPLEIINGFAASLPAQAAVALATNPAVSWVSLDAPVESHALAQDRYYLYNSVPDQDTPAESVLPIQQTAPPARLLYNYDVDRDSGPGILVRRGGSVTSPEGSDLIQRWRLEPFDDDMWLSGTGYLQFFAATREFQPNKVVKVWVHLIHLDAQGEPIGVIASNSYERQWSDLWHLTRVYFPNLNHFIMAGEQLEIAVTVDGASDEDLWFAFGTRWMASYLKLSIQYAQLTAKTFYLVNDLGGTSGDTVSRPVLPFSYRAPQGEILYNYDLDRDNAPGLLLQQTTPSAGGAALREIKRWRLKPFRTDTQMAPNAEVTIFAAVKNFNTSKYAKLWARLNHVDSAGNLVETIATGSVEADEWGATFEPHTIAFWNPTYVIPAGHQLEVALSVDEASAHDMWLAYGTTAYPSQMRASFWPLLPQVYLDTIGAPQAWAKGYEGQGVRVAVIDSGIQADAPVFIDQEADGTRERVIHSVGMVPETQDQYGHGTFVAGVIGSNGSSSGGYYRGVAPKVDLINVRVSDEWGAAMESSVIGGMQWVLEHKDEYNIRVVNMSLNSSVDQPYHVSPLDAAAEILWFNGIVVVVSAGNNGATHPEKVFAPANDPFLIAVGSTDDMGTADPADDTLAASFSARGKGPSGIMRPDVSAPGVGIISALADGSNFSGVYTNYHRGSLDTNGQLVLRNFVASGTSISSGMVAGAAALLLQAVPGLNPDQVKYLLMASATPVEGEPGAGAGILHIARAIDLAHQFPSLEAIPTVNTGYTPSQLLTTGSDPIQWNSVNWNSVNWNSVNWNSVNWNSVNWNSVNWNSTDPAQEEMGVASSEQAEFQTQRMDAIYGGSVLRPPIIFGDRLPDTTEPDTSVPTVPEPPAAAVEQLLFLPALQK